jgi:hypothetical protein
LLGLPQVIKKSIEIDPRLRVQAYNDANHCSVQAQKYCYDFGFIFHHQILAGSITQLWPQSLEQSKDQGAQRQGGRGDGLLAASNGFSSQLVMPFESPPPQARQCNSCGDLKSLNFFALDSNDCRRCELIQREALIAQADQAGDQLPTS